MKIVSVIGSRPQYMKLDKKLEQIVVDTGQHYSPELASDSFFEELDLPKPDYQLGATKLPQMISKVIQVLKKEKPTLVLVYGDTRSTLAGALAASELNIPIGHIEAGMRCYRPDMPEERIRVTVDHMSTYLFTPSLTATANLDTEHVRNNVFTVGNVMYDTFSDLCPLEQRDDAGTYSYLSIHRQENADSKLRLELILEALESSERIVFPIHPRTRKAIKKFKIKIPDNVELIDPVGYKENIRLISGARRVVTDSGGVQNEAFWMGTPCGVLRAQTEWNENVVDEWCFLLDVDQIDIEKFMTQPFDMKKATSTHASIRG